VGVIVTAVTFVAACTMNLWSQPQDPQMQINAMLFLPFAVGATTELLRAASPFRLGDRRAKRRTKTWRTTVGIVACLVGPALLIVNVWGNDGYAERQGWDAQAVSRSRALVAKFDISRTVFVLQGFEGESTWLFELYGSDWDQPGGLPWGPAPSPHAKLIGMAGVPVYFPSLSPRTTEQAVLSRINASRDLGYEIVAGPMWGYSRAFFKNAMSTVASPQKADALYHALHAAYCPHKIRVRGWTGDFYRLTPTPPSGSCAT
jgi:hypothetical protein